MLARILKKFWGYDSFRPLQKEIIDSLMSGRDTLGILPTGGGKSITFQVPALAVEGTAIVVTPLISLMKDQVDNLRKRNIRAVFLHSGMTHREKKNAEERLYNGKAKFLYVSPERLGSERFLNEIKRLKINFIVVDEAHCISQWGYDFRPSYLKITRLRKLFPDVPVLALTASATPDVAEDICRQLQFGPDSKSFRASIRRDNLSYVVRRSDSKLSDIHDILSKVGGSAIVYVRSRKRTREIAEFLTNMEMPSTFYHAGLESDVKESRQQEWVEGKVRVIVATNAFGMGIDKPDVRIVIHYDMPSSLEEYYQEAGRAGRDGLPAFAVLLVAKTDKAVLHRRLTMEFPEKEVIRRIYTRLCVFSHLAIGEGYDKTVDFDIALFCRTFNLDETAVRASLKILGQAEYVEFIEEFENSARVTVTVDREELYKVRFTSREQERILTALLRNYPGLFTDYVFVNEKKLALLAGYNADIIYEKLTELSRMKVINYIPRRKSPMLYFYTSMEEERYIVIGKAVYEDRREMRSRRIEAMIDYAFSDDDCRVATLMRYFGEEGEDCGKCDRCRSRKKAKSLSAKEIEEMLAHLFAANPSGISDSRLEAHFRANSPDAIRSLRTLLSDGIVNYNNNIWHLIQ